MTNTSNGNDFENEVLPSHRKILFDKINEKELPTGQFHGTKSGPKEFKITLNNSRLYFIVTRVTHKTFQITYNTFQHNYPATTMKKGMTIPFEEVLSKFDLWLSNVRKLMYQRNLLDPWEEMQERINTEQTQYETGNFSDDEITAIELVLDKKYVELVEQLELKDQEIEILKTEFDELKRDLKSKSKKKWVKKYLGLILTFAVEMALSPDKVKRATEIIKGGLEILKALPFVQLLLGN